MPSLWSSSTSSSWALPARALGPCPHRSLVVRRQGAQRGAEPPRRGSARCWSLPPVEPLALHPSQSAEPPNGAAPQPLEPQQPHSRQEQGEQQQQGEQHHQSAASSDDGLDEKERVRRARISAANAGKQPWNKGRKHSPGRACSSQACRWSCAARPQHTAEKPAALCPLTGACERCWERSARGLRLRVPRRNHRQNPRTHQGRHVTPRRREQLQGGRGQAPAAPGGAGTGAWALLAPGQHLACGPAMRCGLAACMLVRTQLKPPPPPKPPKVSKPWAPQ